MQDKIINYNITLEAIGPVYIGSGTEINKKDCLYMENEKRVYIMDSMKVFEGMKKNNLLNDYEKFLMDPTQRSLTQFILKYEALKKQYKDWAAYILPLKDISAVINNSRSKGGGFDTISAFVKDPYGCPYIPGSSLKGALRTAFENTLCEERRQSYDDIAKKIENERFFKRAKYLSEENRELSRRIFGSLNRNENPGSASNDIFSFLRVSDSMPLSVSDLILCQKVDVYTDGTMKPLPIKRECLRPGTKISFTVEVDRSYMEMQGNHIEISDKSIYKAVDKSYKNYCDNFLSAFKKITSVSSAGGHLIYIGGGSGFGTKTSVYPLYDNRSRGVSAVQKIMMDTTPTIHKHKDDMRKYNVSPHIRKCTKYNGQLYDMGICRIEIS